MGLVTTGDTISSPPLTPPPAPDSPALTLIIIITDYAYGANTNIICHCRALCFWHPAETSPPLPALTVVISSVNVLRCQGDILGTIKSHSRIGIRLIQRCSQRPLLSAGGDTYVIETAWYAGHTANTYSTASFCSDPRLWDCECRVRLRDMAETPPPPSSPLKPYLLSMSDITEWPRSSTPPPHPPLPSHWHTYADETGQWKLWSRQCHQSKDATHHCSPDSVSTELVWISFH